MITWGIEREGVYSDKDLGEMLNTFVDQIAGLSFHSTNFEAGNRTYSTLSEDDQRNMLFANHVYGGGVIKVSEDPAKLLESFDILDSFCEQHEVDLTYTVLTVHPLLFSLSNILVGSRMSPDNRPILKTMQCVLQQPNSIYHQGQYSTGTIFIIPTCWVSVILADRQTTSWRMPSVTSVLEKQVVRSFQA